MYGPLKLNQPLDIIYYLNFQGGKVSQAISK
jgi:hypothetical protein